MDFPEDEPIPHTEGFTVDYEVSSEPLSGSYLELESCGVAIKHIISSERKFSRLKEPETCMPIQKRTETWTSTPVKNIPCGERDRMRLSMGPDSLNSVQSEASDSSNSSHEDIPPLEYSYDEADMKQENYDLKQQNKKLNEDLRDVFKKLHDAEDRNNILEIKSQNLKSKLLNANIKVEKISEEKKKERDELSERVDILKEKLESLHNRNSRQEKDYNEVLVEKDALHEELNHALTEIHRLSKEKDEMRNELIESQQSSSTEIKRLELQVLTYENQNRLLLIESDDLKISNEYLRRVNTEHETTLNRNKIDDEMLPPVPLDISGDETLDDILIDQAFPMPNSGKSIFAEISASMKKDPSFAIPITRDFSTQYDKDLSDEVKYLNILLSISSEVLKCRKIVKEMFKRGSGPEELYGVEEETQVKKLVSENRDDGNDVVELIAQRLTSDLSQFQEQLKRDQGTLTAIQYANEEEEKKPTLTTISTQTDSFSRNSDAQTTINGCDYVYLNGTDQLSDADNDLRYRIGGGEGECLSIIEESGEHEEEKCGEWSSLNTSPSGGPILMSGSGSIGSVGSSSGRRRLHRMPHTVDEEDGKSELDYMSANSSLPGSKYGSVYNSLERPLQLRSGSGGTNGSDDTFETMSTMSGGNTTYGSPISSPSSPTYRTPSQGSSQETLTNLDGGGRTPINYEELVEELDRPESNISNNSLKEKNPKSTWPMLPIDNRHRTFSFGVIPDEKQEHMQTFAIDAVARSCDPDAAILSRNEWRTLHSDLDRMDLAKFKKNFGQEDDTDESGFGKNSSAKLDLDEMSEKYYEKFPSLVESLFAHLDFLADGKDDSVDDLPQLNKRFEELAFAFRTNHDKLETRTEVTRSEHSFAKIRLTEISSTLKNILLRAKEEKLSGECREIFNSIENSISEIDLHAESLNRAAMRMGHLSLERRLFKMIEVMIFYVRILKTMHGTVEEERLIALKLLEDRGIPFPKKKILGNGNSHRTNNNNVHDKIVHEEVYEDDSKEFLDDRMMKRGGEFEIIRRELHWPWTWEQSWNGVRKGFTIFLMIIGICVILRGFMPGAFGDSCNGDQTISRFFSQIGTLHHHHPPRI